MTRQNKKEAVMTDSDSTNLDPKVNACTRKQSQKFKCSNCYGGKRFCTASCEKINLVKSGDKNEKH